MHTSKRSTLAQPAASSWPAVSRGKALVHWTDCLNLETSKLAQKVNVLWILCAELEAGRCKTIGAHQLSNLLENLAPLKQCALLDDVGKHFIRRLLSYGLSSDYLNATSVLSRPLICWFASHGCTGSCQKLLIAKVNPDVRELNFEAGNPTALLLAARGGHSDCIEVLLDGGADLLLTDDFGVTAMHEAAGSPFSDDNTQAAVLSKLLQHPAAHALLRKGDANKRSPVALAASRGFTACIKLLLDAYDPCMRQQLASRALLDATEAGHTEAAKLLINAGATSMPSSDTSSALEAAAEQGHIGCIALLLRTALKQNDLANALLAAAKTGHQHILHLLLEAGGNVDRPAGPGRTTPLMAAAGSGHLLCTQQLLDWGAEASCSSPDGTTALMVAASGGHTQCVTALIKAGAHVNSHDHSGMSAIMLAAAVGHVMVLRCLIRHKAALERLSFQDSSPLLAAAAAGQGSAVRALLSGGALIDAPDVTGVTAMMAAAAQGHVDCMQILLGFHADLDVMDEQGNTALSSAAKARQHKAVSFLLQNRAKLISEDLSEVYLTLSSSGSSQWDLLQMVCEGSQLEALLTSGDFIALPLGSRPNQTSQVRGVQSLLGGVMRGLMQRLWEQDLSAGQGCALVQAMDCLVSLVKQQPRSRQKPDADLPCFRELFHALSPLLHMLCDLAISQLEVLHLGVHTEQQATQTQQYKGKVFTHMPDRQSPSGSPLSAHQALSQPYPHNSVNLTQLSAILSTISAASQGMQCLSEQYKGAEQEHHTAVEEVQELMKQTTLEHASLFNEALEAACRVSGRQACMVWGWMLEVEGLLNGANWQGLVQGALQALRGSRHMAMWVPRQDMLEDLCHGFVGGTGFASDISAGLEVQFLNESGIGSGVRRDWLNSMMASMLDPQTGLFEAADGGHTWQPCPLAHMQDQHVVYFEMLGRAMGMALLHGEVLPGAHFTPNFLKLLLGQPAKLDDLRGNPPLLTFLKQLAAGQFKPEELCLTFSCANGLGPEADLIPEGSQVEVDSTNWQDYYKHMVAFKLHKSIQREVEAVKKGLQHFVDERTMKLLHRYATPQILDQLLAGESGVDVEDWQAYTLYKNCSEHNHVVKWFWEILQGYSQKQLQALLAFVTCSPVPPAGGFARLAGFNGGRHLFELCLLPEHDDSRLPRAATCFNTLYLPSYSSKQVMHHRLQQASSAQLVFDEGAVHEVAAPRSSTTSRASATSSNSSQRSSHWQDMAIEDPYFLTF